MKNEIVQNKILHHSEISTLFFFFWSGIFIAIYLVIAYLLFTAFNRKSTKMKEIHTKCHFRMKFLFRFNSVEFFNFTPMIDEIAKRSIFKINSLNFDLYHSRLLFIHKFCFIFTSLNFT